MRKVALLIFVVFTFTGCIAPEPTEEALGHMANSTVKNITPETTATGVIPATTMQATAQPSTAKREFHHNYTTARADCRECHPDYPWPRLLDIPFYKQETNESCGQAMLQMVLAYYGINKTQKQISNEMKFGKTYPHELTAYLEKQGLNASILELGDEMWEFDPYAGKHPVLVLEHGEVVDIPLHWVLLKGRGEFGYVIIDPASGGERNWIPGENYTVIVVEGFD